MLVRPQLHVYAVLVEEWLETKEIQDGQTLADDCLVIGTVVAIVIAAVHRTMAIGYDPRTLGAVLRLGGLDQVTFEPLILHDNRLDAVLCEIVDLGAKANKVHRSQVEAVEQIVRAAWHAESIDIVREIAVRRKRIRESLIRLQLRDLCTLRAHLLLLLVIAHTDHVRHIGGNRLHLPHKLISNLPILVAHVVGKVTHVQYGIVHA